MSFRRVGKIAGTAILVLAPALLAFWIGGRSVELRDISKDYLSESRFSQLRFLLLSYHDEHGAFPPTRYQPSPNGPIHSWRVLLLPYIDADCRRLYSEYDFSDTWNSPKNRAVAGSVGSMARGFSVDNNETADYLAIGDGDDWPSERPLKARLITKGKDRFLLVEYPDSQIHWMQPEY